MFQRGGVIFPPKNKISLNKTRGAKKPSISGGVEEKKNLESSVMRESPGEGTAAKGRGAGEKLLKMVSWN